MQFPASESGFSRTRITDNDPLCSAEWASRPLSFIHLQVKRIHTWAPCRAAAQSSDRTVWHRGASSSGFRLSNRDLQPRPEPAGAARGSGEPAPQLEASTLALLGALYLPGGEGTA